MTAPGRVGVIADSTLQGHLLSSAGKGQGYQVLVSTEPDALEDRWLEPDALDLWVVEAHRSRHGSSHLKGAGFTWEGILAGIFDSTKGYPGEGPPRGDIRMITLNANSSNSAIRFIKKHGSEVDIFLLQEVKVALGGGDGAECPVEVFRNNSSRLGSNLRSPRPRSPTKMVGLGVWP